MQSSFCYNGASVRRSQRCTFLLSGVSSGKNADEKGLFAYMVHCLSVCYGRCGNPFVLYHNTNRPETQGGFTTVFRKAGHLLFVLSMELKREFSLKFFADSLIDWFINPIDNQGQGDYTMT